MNSQEEDFLRLLRAAFTTEAGEHLQAMTSGLQDLPKTVEKDRRAAVIEAIFREAHSLKGAARAVNAADIEAVCQALESVFAEWKRDEVAATAGAAGLLLRAVDAASNAVAAAVPIPAADVAALVREIAGAGVAEKFAKPRGAEKNSAETAVPEKFGAEQHAAIETVRVPVARLDRLIADTEEFLSARMSASQRSADLRDLEGVLERWREEWSGIHPRMRDAQQSVDRHVPPALPDLVRLFEFLDWNQHHIKLIEEKLLRLSRATAHDHHEMDKRVGDVLEGSKKLAMLPCYTMLAALPKMVRELCRDRGKDAEITIHGADLEVDKHILEELKDPLIHIVRNCVDHGIETPEIRIRRNKLPRGTIKISISQTEGNKVALVISDDGGGIDVAKLKKTAVGLGVLSAADAAQLDDRDAVNLIFESGVSTSPAITEISGRGLGLAIVREKTEKLAGQVAVESEHEKGVTFRLVVPLTRATFRGILVQAGGRDFVIPVENTERIARVNRNEIKTVENRETLSNGGRTTSFVHLADILDLERRKGVRPENFSVMVLKSGERRIAFGVDEVLYETEVPVKPLGALLLRVRNVAAATVLGGGQVVPILNVADLMLSAIRLQPRAAHVAARPRAVAKKASLLVVEDSITARMLLKNILEAAGHGVKTAVDGVEALTTLRTEDFDLVVSDVDMPRMHGLELTARIRADKKLADKPVILVTSLASDADRERGVQAGANAYIVKSNFDQSNLLAAIDRLL